jgi:hypothetical protein
MAKATPDDLKAAGVILRTIEEPERALAYKGPDEIQLVGRFLSVQFPEDNPFEDETPDMGTEFDEDNLEHLQKFYRALKSANRNGCLLRIVGGMYTILDEQNAIVDPDKSYFDLHPRIKAALVLAESQSRKGSELVQGAKKENA